MNRLMISVVLVTIPSGAVLSDDAHFVFPAWARCVPSGAREALTVADFNDDDIPDVALHQPSPGGTAMVTILDGQPDGSLGEPRDYAAGPKFRGAWCCDMAGGDLVPDPQDLPDLVVTGLSEGADANHVSILRNTGSAARGSPAHTAGPTCR